MNKRLVCSLAAGLILICAAGAAEQIHFSEASSVDGRRSRLGMTPERISQAFTDLQGSTRRSRLTARRIRAYAEQTRGYRQKLAKEYLDEFCSRAIVNSCPKMYAAIRDVLARMPVKSFFVITQRDYPILFTEYHYEGQGRLAVSSSIRRMEEDPPTFQNGFWMVKLSTELEDAYSQEIITGIIAHEVAHRVLGHRPSQSKLSAERLERMANRLVRRWGFENEIQAAQDADTGHSPISF